MRVLFAASNFEMSTNLPLAPRQSSDASSPLPVSDESTTSTPLPSVAARTSRTNVAGLRESDTTSHLSTSRSIRRFSSDPAVAMTVAPTRCARRTAACPTPPAALWISTVSPLRSLPCS